MIRCDPPLAYLLGVTELHCSSFAQLLAVKGHWTPSGEKWRTFRSLSRQLSGCDLRLACNMQTTVDVERRRRSFGSKLRRESTAVAGKHVLNVVMKELSILLQSSIVSSDIAVPCFYTFPK